jgi:hypothetical protein
MHSRALDFSSVGGDGQFHTLVALPLRKGSIRRENDNIKMNLNGMSGKYMESEQFPVKESCKYSNKPSKSIICKEFCNRYANIKF